jgi:hypothetical protein
MPEICAHLLTTHMRILGILASWFQLRRLSEERMMVKMWFDTGRGKRKRSRYAAKSYLL